MHYTLIWRINGIIGKCAIVLSFSCFLLVSIVWFCFYHQTAVLLSGTRIGFRISVITVWHMMVKVQFRGPDFLRKMGHYFNKNCTYLVSLCSINKLTIRLWMDGFNLNVILIVLSIWFCHTAPIASTWQSVLSTYQRRYQHVVVMLCNLWLARAPVQLHCDVMITTSTTKTWWSSCRSLGVNFAMLTEENLPPNTMLMRWKYVNLAT